MSTFLETITNALNGLDFTVDPEQVRQEVAKQIAEAVAPLTTRVSDLETALLATLAKLEEGDNDGAKAIITEVVPAGETSTGSTETTTEGAAA